MEEMEEKTRVVVVVVLEAEIMATLLLLEVMEVRVLSSYSFYLFKHKILVAEVALTELVGQQDLGEWLVWVRRELEMLQSILVLEEAAEEEESMLVEMVLTAGYMLDSEFEFKKN